MAKVTAYIAFCIYCGMNMNHVVRAGQVTKGAIITDDAADKLWDDGQSIGAIQLEETTVTNCDMMEDGRLFVLEWNPMLFVRNALDIIK
ncbi:hypothetical protein LOAG_10508 [Loa loa]|uniref:Uncharacterized protein n=1 Tax=Loa loa TaxID=7209 RepID=A0A1S0TPT7_LOALO|nr:hypothetical protein LOAG_10508 [Loa loa]EFO17992.1 hypothetical protein LOAG_10508 [Loa loa]